MKLNSLHILLVYFVFNTSAVLKAQSNIQCLFEPSEEALEINNQPEDTIQGVYLIPTVVHVLYHNTVDNISTNQVLDGIQLLNADFRKQNLDTSDIIAPFKQLAADTKIEFRLAQIDPDGNPTDGITRTYTDSTKFMNLWDAFYDSTGGKSAWPTNMYLNIWVVKEFAGITGGGRGSSPSNSFPERQGIIITNNQIGSVGTGMGSRVFTHEAGHFFNLLHLWAYLGTPGDTANCNKDDGVQDTPNCFGSSISYGTPTGLWAQSCGSLDNVQNYMDYSGYFVPRMFTYGQADRMHAALNSTVGGRDNLHELNNLIATGICAPSSVNNQIKNMNTFNIYPNPATSYITLTSSKLDLKGKVVTIVDVTGKQAIQQRIGYSKIDVNNIKKGVYFVKLEGSSCVKKLIKN